MKKIVVTGGSGFIGSNLVNFLVKKIIMSLILINLVTPQIDITKNIYQKEDINFLS